MSDPARLAPPQHVDPYAGATEGRSYESVVRELREVEAELAAALDELAALRVVMERNGMTVAIFRSRPRPWQPAAPAECCGMSGDCTHARQCRARS